MKRSTLSITHGAITASITVVLLLVDRLIAGFLMSFLPIPLIVYGLYYSIKESFLTYIVTVLLVMIIPGQLPTTMLMIVYGFVGLVYIAVFKTDLSKIMKFIIVFIGVAIGYYIMVRFFGQFFGLDFSTTMMEVETMFKITDPTKVRILAFTVIFLTMFLETLIIFMAANLVTMRIKRHRN